MGELEDEYDYRREIEPDEHTLNENMNRSRYFFAMISFLIAFIILAIYFNNYYDILSGWFLLAGVLTFGAIGFFFLRPNSILNNLFGAKKDLQSNEAKNTFLTIENTERLEEG